MAPKYQQRTTNGNGQPQSAAASRGGYQHQGGGGGTMGRGSGNGVSAGEAPRAWAPRGGRGGAPSTTAPAVPPAVATPKPHVALYFSAATFRDERRKELYNLRLRSAALLGLTPEKAMPSSETAVALCRKIKLLAPVLTHVPEVANLRSAVIGRVRMVLRPTTAEHATQLMQLPTLDDTRVLIEYLVFVLEKYHSAVDIGGILSPLLQLANLLPVIRCGVNNVLSEADAARLEQLRCAAFIAVGALLEQNPMAVYTNVELLFPAQQRGSSEAQEQTSLVWNMDDQPLLASLRKDTQQIRATVVYALCVALLGIQDQLALAVEPSTRPARARTFVLAFQPTHSFVSLSERMATLLRTVHVALVQTLLDPADESPLLRSRALNALASLIQMTPYIKCPACADTLFTHLIPSPGFAQSIRRPRVASERVAALFCLTALNRNIHATLHVRDFFVSSRPTTPRKTSAVGVVRAAAKEASSSPTAASTPSEILNMVIQLLPSLDAFRVICSLGKDQPDILRAFWHQVKPHIEAVVRSIPLTGRPCYRSTGKDEPIEGGGPFDVDIEKMDRVRDDGYQTWNEAIRTLLYFMGPCTPKYTDEQWAAELSGGNYYQRTAMQTGSLSEAKQLGVETAGIGAPKFTSGGKLAISKFSIPLPPAEAASRGPGVGARATADERVACLHSVILHARYSKSEGPRRLGLRCLAHIGDAALRAMSTDDATAVFRSVVEDGTREPRVEQHLDILATMSKWVSHYTYFATPSCFKAFAARVAWYLSNFQTDSFVCAAATDVALALMQRAVAMHKDATIDEAVVLQVMANARHVAEVHKVYPVVVGQCLKCLAAAVVLLQPSTLQSTITVNEKDVAVGAEVLTRLHRSMDPAVKGVTVDDDASRLRRALACLCAKEVLLSPSIRATHPELCATLTRRICLGVLLGLSFEERIAACRVLSVLPATLAFESGMPVSTLIKNVAEATRFASNSNQRSTLKQVQSLKVAAKNALRAIAIAAQRQLGLESFLLWVEVHCHSDAALKAVVEEYSVELKAAGMLDAAEPPGVARAETDPAASD